jgi:NADPH:quinone reductase-like Zn-dependent oxidoreductase
MGAGETQIWEMPMRAMQVVEANGKLVLKAAEVPVPNPGNGEVLVRIHAAGVTPTELLWSPTTHTKAGEARTLAVPGHEFSGVVEEVGEGVSQFAAGDAVYGMNDWFADGATAEFCTADAGSIAAKSARLTHEEAATVPIGALTAWQGLFTRAKVQPGERVLIQGGSGAVGLFVVQLAKLHGAKVIATASAENASLVKQFGAETVIDYKAERFEDQVRDVDVVFDTVGGETLGRSWGVLRSGGRMVTIAADAEGQQEQRVKDAFFIVKPNQEQLVEVARLLDAGILKTFVKAAVPLDEAPAAYAGQLRSPRAVGKVVVSIL